MSVTPLELAKIAATAADEKKATEIMLLDLTELTDVSDYFLICTAANNPQMDAVVDAIKEKVLLNCDEKPFSVEGRDSANWVLMDYGSVVCHVFKPESRDFYRLEKLWGEAPLVELGFGESASADDAEAAE